MKKKGTKKRFLLVANWKMNPDSLEDAKVLAAAFERKAKKSARTAVVVCPPAPFITTLVGNGKKSVRIGSQDIDHRTEGSFTGSVSARQVRTSGAEYAIIGHSERRAAGDTDAIIVEKVLRAFEAGLKVILCVGEDKRDHNAQYLLAVRSQLMAVLAKVEKSRLKQIVIAYEPVWAIGKSFASALSPRDIHEMSIFIKKVVAEAAGKDAGLRAQVLYGGSVSVDSARDMLAEGGVDGLLVGRQSLDAENFNGIIDHADSI
ncbi:MAG: triose-phosphate isomerase [bacterium]|nr:triose-phosphate isomerase [bacterium]